MQLISSLHGRKAAKYKNKNNKQWERLRKQGKKKTKRNSPSSQAAMRPNLERLVNALAIGIEFRAGVLEPALWEKGKGLDKILRETVGNFLGNANTGLLRNINS